MDDASQNVSDSEESLNDNSRVGVLGRRNPLKPIQFGENGSIINLGVKGDMVKGVYNKSVLAGPQSLGIRDYLDKTEMKIKDA